MSILYDPQKRQARLWVLVSFLLIPFLVMVGVWVLGQHRAKNRPAKTQTEQP